MSKILNIPSPNFYTLKNIFKKLMKQGLQHN